MSINNDIFKIHGVLVQLKSKVWYGTKQVKNQGDVLADDANKNWLTTRKQLVQSEKLKELKKVPGECRRAIQDLSVAFPLDNVLYVPFEQIDTIKGLVEYHRNRMYGFRDAFIQEYAERVEEARTNLGKAFNEDDYPSPTEMSERFKLELVTLPPFKTEFDNDAEEKAYADLFEDFKQEATAKLRERFVELVGTLTNQLAVSIDPETGEQKKGKLYESTLKKVNDFVGMIEQLNIGNDETLDDACQRIKKLLVNNTADDFGATYTTKDLKDNDTIRGHLVKQFTPLVEKFSNPDLYDKASANRPKVKLPPPPPPPSSAPLPPPPPPPSF